MDFVVRYTPEMEQFRAEVREFIEKNDPHVLVSSNPDDITDAHELQKRDFRRLLATKGWLFPTGPKAYGGGGLSGDHASILAEEFDAHKIYYAGGGGGASIACTLVWGTDEQKKKFGERLLRGELSTWELYTEPQGGSDMASARTMAIRDGDDYVVNGTKIFVGGKDRPDLLFTLVNTDPEGARHQNLSYLFIPADAPGVTINPFKLLSNSGGYGDRNAEANKNQIFFDDVRVPAGNRIGEHNKGWAVSSTSQEMLHGGGGNIRKDLHMQRLYNAVHEYEWDGRPLIEDTETREVLAEVIQKREIARLFDTRNYWIAHNKVKSQHENPESTYWLKSRMHRMCEEVQEILGHYANQRDPNYMVSDGFLEFMQRNVFVTVHGLGGLNIQATVLARRLALGRNTAEEAGRISTDD